MQAVSEKEMKRQAPKPEREQLYICYHCGAPCVTNKINIDEKLFCCEGCKLVYEIINDNGLCDYYRLQSHPGLSQIKPIRNDKYAYLDDDVIASKLYDFTDGDRTIVTFYIPGVHCTSCLWLLEHLNKLDRNISESRVNFTTKDVTIHFSRRKTSLRAVVELLATIGYEPYISLNDTDKKNPPKYDKRRIYKLGITGFCFGNIMMLSFPEYLAHLGIEAVYVHVFRYMSLLLSLPVFFYGASEFFITAWKGLQQKMLNIDAPIALAIVITFTRSIYEILSNTGSGYLDSMSGIVFFMLAGRIVQERTYRSISFNRDYKSYFPIAVTVVLADGVTETKMLSNLKEKDLVLLRNDEIIPADAIVVGGNALIDYSFVTGESEPVAIKRNEMVYAGGKQTGAQVTIEIIKPVAGSYLTSLWSHYAFSQDKTDNNNKDSSIHLLSKYFTWVLFSLALITGIYWAIHDPSKIMSSVTAMLIVACPCALLLSSTFTNGNLLRIFSNNGLFLRDQTVIEQLGKTDHIVFDKTGTITQSSGHSLMLSGHQWTEEEKNMVFSVVCHSNHPNSKALASWLGSRTKLPIADWVEMPGRGLEAKVGDNRILAGSALFAGVPKGVINEEKATVYVRINDEVTSVHFLPVFRSAIPAIIHQLRRKYSLSLLSGDNDRQKKILEELFEKNSELLFEQSPLDKLHYIQSLQEHGGKVLMIGDGLNDAGALQQSNVGITLADDINNFTPSCDAILDAKKINLLPSVLRLAVASRYIIMLSFAVSIMYNIAGLYFAVQGLLKPMMAAILMPCSTLSIVLITSGVSSLVARSFGLSLRSEE